MKTIPLVLLAGLLIASPIAADTTTGNRTEKQTAMATIESHREEMIRLSDEIWRYAETALQETRSSKVLADWAEKEGFRVRWSVPGLPTAFVAEYGSGRPVIGIMGEYDALPGISQKAQPTKEAMEEGGAGHGCGHNLFGRSRQG